MKDQKEHDFIVMTDEELMLLTGGDNFLAVDPSPAVDPDRRIPIPLYGIRPPEVHPLYGVKPPDVNPLYGITPPKEWAF